MPTTQLRIGPADHGRQMSLDEFRDAEEADGYRYELAGGVLEVTEVPNTPHRRVVSNLYRAIARYDAEHPGVIESFGGGAGFLMIFLHVERFAERYHCGMTELERPNPDTLLAAIALIGILFSRKRSSSVGKP